MDEKTLWAFAGGVIAVFGKGLIDTIIQKTTRNRNQNEKIHLAIAELRNALRHFERSEQNIKSYIENQTRPRRIDILKTSYSKDGFIAIKMSDLIGLPTYMSRDLMQLGMVYRNQELEIENALTLLLDNDELNNAGTLQFLKRMKTVAKITDDILNKLEVCKTTERMSIFTQHTIGRSRCTKLARMQNSRL